MSGQMRLTVAIVVASDRAFKGRYEDRTGPALAKFLGERGWEVVRTVVVPDDKPEISSVLKNTCDEGAASLVVTAGGTGLGPRDVTPEATREVVEKELPGLAELMRSKCAARSPRAALSRAVAGARGRSIILNVPGSPAGAVESLETVLDLIPHAIEMAAGHGHAGEKP